jgi:catechol 2,3-dioxygenase-like lactoylglutathione lyase family enzyme
MTTDGLVSALHHVQLAAPVGSEPALQEFYAGVLGMTEAPKPVALAGRGGVWFASGTAELHVGIEDDFRPARKAHPGLLVSGLDALVARLAAAGHELTWDGALPGYRRCYLVDPVGNRLELLEPAC